MDEDRRKSQGVGYRKGNSVKVTRWKNHVAYKWRASFIESGSYHSKGFKTKKAAEEWAGEKEAELFVAGSEDPLTFLERSAVLEFRDRIAALGVPIRDVLEREVLRLEMTRRSVTVREAVEEMIELKARTAKSDRNLETVKSQLNRFARDRGDMIVSDVSLKDVDDWLLGLTVGKSKERVSAQTWRNYRRHLKMLFGQCVAWEYCDSNPVEKAQEPEKAETEPGILTPREAGDLLTGSGPEIQAAIAIGLFAGLRVSEIQRITWEEVNLARNLIKLEGAVTKKKFRRIIPIRPNLRAWLLLSQERQGQLAPHGQGWRLAFAAVRRRAGFAVRLSSKEKEKPLGKEWKVNAMRHSYASYGIQNEQDAAKIALELGHRGSTQTLFEHYKAICEPEEAESYWNIYPEEDGKIVSIA